MEVKSISDFATDINNGLSSSLKSLPSKYFYDEAGDRIFQQIMKLDEYYLTRSEFEILKMQKHEILKRIQAQFGERKFQLVEFGAGDGLKTKLLLDHFLSEKVNFQYVPIDISESILEELSQKLKEGWPDLDFQAVADTYTEGLKRLDGEEPKILLFLGSNLGNFLKDEANAFVQEIHKRLNPGDMIFFGIDLKKDPQLILDAYNDKAGVTRAFNLNLLQRINRELGANFQLENFSHYPTYDPVSGICKSYLVSLRNQSVYVEELDKTFEFDYGEPIHTEVSIKYGLKEVENLFGQNGFEKIEHFFDCKKYFVNTIWART